MKAGVCFNFQNYQDWERFEAKAVDRAPVVSDQQIWDEELHLYRLADPLGFDAMWALDHHFAPYIMSGSPLFQLSHFAGLSSRLDVGSMVIVLPWYDPITIAEQICVLDQMLQGRRLILGVGRGVAQREFDTYRVPLSESRGRFMESIEIIRLALTQEWFSFEGEHFTIPETTIRPRPRTANLAGTLKAAWVSPESLSILANAGVGMLLTNQKSWDGYQKDVRDFNAVRADRGWEPLQPTVVVNVSCADSADEAWEVILRHTVEMQDSIERHYHFTDSAQFKNAAGYDYYASFGKTLTKKTPEEIGEFNAQPQAWGTPQQCLEKIEYIQRMTSAEEFIFSFRYGGMPADVAERSMRLFAEHVLPQVHAWDPRAVAASG